MKNKNRVNHLLRMTTALVAAGLIAAQIPSTSNAAFAQGIYVNPDEYIKKSDVQAMQLRSTAITLAGVGAIAYITTLIQASTAAAAASAAAAAAASAAASAGAGAAGAASAGAGAAAPAAPAPGAGATTPSPAANPAPSR